MTTAERPLWLRRLAAQHHQPHPKEDTMDTAKNEADIHVAPDFTGRGIAVEAGDLEALAWLAQIAIDEGFPAGDDWKLPSGRLVTRHDVRRLAEKYLGGGR